jgi:hypothetical protein
VETAFWKGAYPPRRLFEVVLTLSKLDMKNAMTIHVVHVSGKRMIPQGTDGLSCADHSGGVMQGRSMMEFIPLHRDPPLSRKPKLRP